MALVVTIVREQAEPIIYAATTGLIVLAVINLKRARAQRTALLRRKRELGG